jgi:hypothetical protein
MVIHSRAIGGSHGFFQEDKEKGQESFEEGQPV